MADTLHYIDTFTDLLRQAICLISQMKHDEYILALKQWQIADSMVQSLSNQFDVLENSYANSNCMREDDNDSVDSAKIREQIDLMVEEFPEENEKSSSWTIFNDTFLMFSDEELETIFRKAFIRSKSKNPHEFKEEESQPIKKDWSNQICDKNKGLNEEIRKSSDQAVLMMSFSDNSNTYTSSSDTDSVYPLENQSLDTTRLNCVEASVNITAIQQSSSSPLPHRETKTTSLTKDHMVLTSLLEQKTDFTKKAAFKSTPLRKSQFFDTPFSSNGNVLSSERSDDFAVQSLGSNITHLVQKNDLNNLKIEIVMELDKGMANAINSDSKYKIKIGPEHFNNICVGDFPKRVEHKTSSVYVESFSASETNETISSSYQVKTSSHSTSAGEDTYDRQNDGFKKVTDNIIDVANRGKSVEKKTTKRDDKKYKDLHHANVNRKQKYNSEEDKQNENSSTKNKRNCSRKHSVDKIEDNIKFTSAIPSKQYSRSKDETHTKNEKHKDRNRKRNEPKNHSPEDKILIPGTNDNEIIFEPQCGLMSDTTLNHSKRTESHFDVTEMTSQNDQLNESYKIEEKLKSNMERVVNEEDDDVVLLEEKGNNMPQMKLENIPENEPSLHVVKSNTENLANSNFFLISNDSSKDKQSVKYLILNNNNLFKTLNFDSSNKTHANGMMNNETGQQQTNLLLLNNDKNGNMFLLNKDVMKQSNSFVLNNNALYNPCETQYFIINDSSAFPQQVTDVSENKCVAPPATTLNFTSSCESLQFVEQSTDQIKIAMDTPIDIQENDSSIRSCAKHYDTQLDYDKNNENTADAPMLSQEPSSGTKSTNKDLIQNKENILVLNNHVSEEHFKFDSNDASVQIRLGDSMYYLNEKISNELKMGSAGKCSEIPQIYFINDLDSPLSVSNDYRVDTNVKETQSCVDQTPNQLELLNYDDLLLRNDNFQLPSNSDTSSVIEENFKSNVAQFKDKSISSIFKPDANSSFRNDESILSDEKIENVKKTTKSSLKTSKSLDAKLKPVPVKNKLTPLKQNSSSFLKHLKSKLEKQKPVSKNQILNKAPSNYLHKNAPIVKKTKLDDMDSVLTNDPVENATKILALCMKKETEAQQKSLACHICSMVFCDNLVLSKHVEEHSSLGKFTCTVCKKVFNNMKTLKTHSRIHTGEKPFRCSVCGKSFSQRGILSSHLAVHAGVKPHICKQCGHAFTQKSQLRLHEMRHGNIRHFACNVCPFKFTTKSDLQRHQRSHEGVKPFRCEYCDKTFTRQIILKEHLNRHKGVQPYSCSHCDKTFFEAQSLNKHKLSHKSPGDTSSLGVINGSKLFGGIG